MMSKILNLTPHVVNIYDASSTTYVSEKRSYVVNVGAVPSLIIESTTPPARCTQEIQSKGLLDVDGCMIPIVGLTFGGIMDLPDATEDTYYIVSAIVANAGRNQGRTDLLVPTDIVRNEDGTIVGCVSLAAE